MFYACILPQTPCLLICASFLFSTMNCSICQKIHYIPKILSNLSHATLTQGQLSNFFFFSVPTHSLETFMPSLPCTYPLLEHLLSHIFSEKINSSALFISTETSAMCPAGQVFFFPLPCGLTVLTLSIKCTLFITREKAFEHHRHRCVRVL